MFKTNLILFMHSNLFNIYKVKVFLNKGFDIVSYTESTDFVTLELSKIKFFKFANKINNLTTNIPHYANAKGICVLAAVENNTVVMKKGLIVESHTSYKPNKYNNNSTKQLINDTLYNYNINGQINSTLIPTDSKYTGSYIHVDREFYPLSELYKINFKNNIIRVSDQKEIIKSNTIINDILGIETNIVFFSTNNQIYYSYSNFFENHLITNNIIINPNLKYLITNKDKLMNSNEELNFSISDYILNSNILNTITIKVKKTEFIVNTDVIYLNSGNICESDNYNKQNVSEAEQLLKNDIKSIITINNNNTFNSLANINSQFVSDTLEESNVDIFNTNNSDSDN